MKVGIMQGRLLPPTDGRLQAFPRDRWREEFALAADAGLATIEWIYEGYGAEANPIATDDGLALILEHSEKSGVQIRSICADYFMERPLVRASEREVEDRVSTLMWLLDRSALLGVQRVVLPFVDNSSIDSDEEQVQIATILNQVAPALLETGLEIHLETSLAPRRFAELLAKLPATGFKVNYDSGNSASLGYDSTDEFAAYGERVGSVHIKDRTFRGGTVALGTGDTDFRALFDCLAARDFSGDFVLQVARGTDGDEIDWARRNREFVRAFQAGSG